ncbi:MAG: sulfatase-like hydrolase/transferase [Deltaproteobacteria bacterium]|nr:sulfatase-like hydrolase/transferase [Deltaproteobacteria bacterium]
MKKTRPAQKRALATKPVVNERVTTPRPDGGAKRLARVATGALRAAFPRTAWIPLLASISFGAVAGAYAWFSLGERFHPLVLLDIFALAVFVAGVFVLLPRRRIWRWPLLGVFALVVVLLHIGFLFYFRFYQSWPTLEIMLQWRDAAGLGTSFFELLRWQDLVFGVAIPAAMLVVAEQRFDGVPRLGPAIGLLVVLAVLVGTFEATRAHPLARVQNEPVMYLLRDGVAMMFENDRALSKRTERVKRHTARYYPFDDDLYNFDPTSHGRLKKVPDPDRERRTFVKKNVLLVVLESVRAFEMGLYGAKASLTPNLDALGAQSLVFDPFYANAHQTQRSECAIHCSMYERVSGGSIFQTYPDIHLKCLPSIFKDQDYHTLLLKSYKGNYANARTFFKKHGMKEVRDIKDYETIPHTMVGWGPSDEDHVRHSLDVIDRSAKPFFAELLTLSNHYPFQQSYPTDPVFPGKRYAGDYDNYSRGIYYTDHSIGLLMDLAKDKPWFHDTIFIFVGDHGIWRFPDDVKLDMTRKLEIYFRLPMMIYTPDGSVAPGMNRELGSHVDIPPTLLDLMGLEVENGFVGRSLLRDNPRPRYAMMVHDDQWNIRRENDYCYDAANQYREDKFYGPKLKKNAKRNMSYCFSYEGDLLRDLNAELPPPDPELNRLHNFGLDLIDFNDWLIRNDLVFRRTK